MKPEQISFLEDDAVETTGEITLDRLRMVNRTRQIEWGAGDKITIDFSAIELAGEIGELLDVMEVITNDHIAVKLAGKSGKLLNVIKKMLRERLNLRGSRASLEDLENEFADVLITLDLLAMRMKVDLTAALRRKFNETSSKLGLMTKL
jgi:NTP pyrophosphatase (non-canonical NTP hydrolase)